MSALVINPGPVTTVELNRPDVRNALDDGLIGELTDWAASIRADGSVRAVVLRGAGEVFCAGADIGWMARTAAFTTEQNLDDARRTARMLQAIDSLPVPVVGRVHGAAIGGGAGLAALCDIVIAAEATIFAFPEARLGIVPAMIAPYVVRKIGMSAARELCLSGVRFDARRAREIGLVHDVVPAGELDAAVLHRVEAFLRAAPSAIAVTKRLIADVAGRRPADVLSLTVDTIAAQRASPDGQEGLRAFLEKRPPAWDADPAPAPGNPAGDRGARRRRS
jgi:methylglutaconyl-CoA hydratase